LKDGGKNVQLTRAGCYYNDKGERIVQEMQIAGASKKEYKPFWENVDFSHLD
jgi:hypothetical protein